MTAYKAIDNSAAYFVTITVVEWIDLFTRQNHKNTIINALKYAQQNKGLELYAYAIMPSHIHLLCRVKEGFVFSDFIRDFKRHTAKELIENIENEIESRRQWLLNTFKKEGANASKPSLFKVWQEGYHAINVYSNKFIHQKLEYIHNNPVNDGIVEKPEDYLYSSARNYAGLDSVLEVVVLPPKLKEF